MGPKSLPTNHDFNLIAHQKGIHTMTSRDETISRIKTALKKRSGKSWSVTGGKGTAWGWIKIDVLPAKQTAHFQLKAGLTTGHTMDDYDDMDTGEKGGHMTPTDRAQLKELLGLDSLHHQGVSIMASSDAYQEYIDRAEGRTPTKIAEPYWD
jgi:hypothetical protein